MAEITEGVLVSMKRLMGVYEEVCTEGLLQDSQDAEIAWVTCAQTAMDKGDCPVRFFWWLVRRYANGQLRISADSELKALERLNAFRQYGKYTQKGPLSRGVPRGVPHDWIEIRPGRWVEPDHPAVRRLP